MKTIASRIHFFTRYLLPLLCWCSSIHTAAQIPDATAYNRFQYHAYKWKVLRTPLFQLYFPRGYDSLASFASVQLPDIITELKTATTIEVKSIPNLVLYPSVTQLYESNIGIHQETVQTFPTINLKGDRVMLAFNGSYEAFRLQLKAAWMRLCWDEQFKDGAEEQLTNSRSLVPPWFKEGCIRYFAYGWEIKEEAAWQQLLKKTTQWEELAVTGQALSGQAFCYFLTHKYRPDAAMQCFFQLRQGKSLARAVRLVTKRRLDSLTAECLRYYKARPVAGNNFAAASDTLQSFLEKRYKGQLFALGYNRDSTLLSFCIQKDNKRSLYIAGVKEIADPKHKAKPFTYYLLPPWLQDHNDDPYPLMQWQPGNMLTLVMPEKGKLRIRNFNERGYPATERTFYGIDGIQSFLQQDAAHWLLSAYRRGRSDIVRYDINTLRYTPLTTDDADHTELAFDKSSNRIVYRSGYPADSLYHKDTLAKPYGVYRKELNNKPKEAGKSGDAAIATDSAFIHWHHPAYGPDGVLTIENTASGDIRRIPADAGSISAVKDKINSRSPWVRDYLKDLRVKDSTKTLLANAGGGEPSFLQGVLQSGDSRKAALLQKDSLRKSVAYSYKKLTPYILQLHSAYFSAAINNDYFINRYQPFQAYLGTFKFPEAGAMISGGFSDLFENHQFNIGYRLPAGTEGSDFFVRYENAARQTDWHVLFFRKVESLQPDAQRDWKDRQGNPYPAAAKVKTHYYELGFHTPLRYDWSLDYSLAARRDRTIFLATDRYSLNYEALQSWWGIGNIALKANKIHTVAPLLEKGWQGKLLLDGMASTGKQSTMVYGAQFSFYYAQPLIKDITLAARVQGGYSDGQSRILYNFGGMDNNMVTRVDTSVRFGQNAPFAFQTLVTPFRGYEQNSIYGSRFGLLNLDLYFPLFRSLIPLHTSFSSLKNLQVGLFTDIAKTAGATGLPAAPTQLSSFGFSVRTMLAGYPIRFDMAWPGSFNKTPLWYLSLTLK